MARKKTIPISRKPTGGPMRRGSSEPFGSGSPAAIEAASGPGAGSSEASRQCAPKPASGPLGRVLYGAVFGLSYGVVFTAILVGRLIPGSDLIGRGLRDGGDSAQRFFKAEPESPESKGSVVYSS